ncbi:MAG: VirB3 family type IV secretion system protein [Candidatus Tectimicrobiota bacterium]
MDDEIPGFVVPLYRSLTTPLLLAGAPRAMAILNGTLTAALGLGLHCLWAIPLGVLVHLGAVLAAKHDPQYVDVLRAHLRRNAYYHA